jgi:PAS domain S-box-containing protein
MVEDATAGSGFIVTHVADRLEMAARVMQSGEVDLALLDLTLRDAKGVETFSYLHGIAPELPIVVLSAVADEQLALEAVHLGAQEYLVKGHIDAPLLHRAMRYALERARTEAALAHERELLHTLLENIPDRIYFKDRESRFIRINQALTDLFRLVNPEEAYGKTDADFYGEEHSREAREDEERVMETGEPMLGKIERETLTSGRHSWSLTTKLPLRDRQGRIVGTCGISREITEFKQMEEQLGIERNLLRSVINNLPDLIFLKDTAGRYLLNNRAHQEWLGVSRSAEVIGRTAFDFYTDEVAETFQQTDNDVLATGVPLINLEERIVDRSGGKRWVQTTKVPWRDDDETMLGLVCISRDITERKAQDEHLREANAELARSREEVLAAMDKLQAAHQELRSVQLQLIEAEKMKSIGRLAAGVAHEVKNPLQVLKIGVEYLSSQESARDEVTGSVLADMTDAVNRADAVIRGLLDFSAPKKLEAQLENLNNILNRALTLVKGEMKGIELIREMQRDLPTLKLDAGKIGQVFINLIGNAIHAMLDAPSEHPHTLTVRTYSKQLTGVGANVASAQSESFRVGETLVIAEIDDTGPGIPEDKLPKIFEPFFTTKPTGKGTGLGLSVVKTIIDLHRATVDLRNLPDGGTRVTVAFQV